MRGKRRRGGARAIACWLRRLGATNFCFWKHLGEGTEMSTRGACAPQRIEEYEMLFPMNEEE
jgi:hypothetical protein